MQSGRARRSVGRSSKQCVPNEWIHSIHRRTLFDEEDWEAEEYFRPLSRRCQGITIDGVRCKVTASHPGSTARPLKQGDDFCLDHGGFNGGICDNDDDDSDDDGDFYFDRLGA